MKVILEMLESPDLALLILIGLLAFIGGKMTAGMPDLKSWGNRSSAAAFLIYAAYGIHKYQPDNAVGLLNVAVSGVVAAGLMGGGSRILLGAWAFMTTPPASLLARWIQVLKKNHASERMQRERAMQVNQDRELCERSAPERERAKQEAAADAKTKAQAQKRRAGARAQCEFLYHLYSPEIESRFPRSKFDDFVAKYLSDRESPEEVEAHAEQLRTILDTHVKKADPRSRFKNLRDLTNWYEEQKTQIDLLPEGSLKGSLFALLHARHAELSFQVLEELTP